IRRRKSRSLRRHSTPRWTTTCTRARKSPVLRRPCCCAARCWSTETSSSPSPGSDSSCGGRSSAKSCGRPLRPRRSKHAQREQFEHDVGCGERRRLPWAVVGRGNLHDVAARKGEPAKRAQEGNCLCRRKAGDLRRAGPGSEGRVEEVDVERQEDGTLPHLLLDER